MSEYTAAQIAEKINGTILGDADRKKRGARRQTKKILSDNRKRSTAYRGFQERVARGYLNIPICN